MTNKVTLVCTECLSRNYTANKNKNNQNKRLEVRKYCPKCNRHTLHKEAK